MSSSLSNLVNFSVPLSSHRRPITQRVRPSFLAMGGDGRDSLDHLQKASKQQGTTQSPKRRTSQPPPLGLWDRFPSARTVQQMMDTMERIMEDPLAYSVGSTGGSLGPLIGGEEGGMGSGYRRGRTPWEIKEGEGDYKMRFDMPGMTRGDVKVWVEEKMLVIKAEKHPKKEKEEEGEEEWSARSYGRYNTRIALPDNVVLEKIKAEVRDGVLYVTIPKAPSSTQVLDIDVQ